MSGCLARDEEIPRAKTCAEFDWAMNDDRLKNCALWS